MDGFKNTTKTSYDTSSGRKFANGGMTVSRADMPGGEGPMRKPAMVAKYAKGGHVKKAEQKIGRVMTEFTEGKLHSGSKEGPKVKSTKQAVAIALNEARAAGAKIPRVKKFAGGMMEEGGTYNERGKRATMAEIAAEGRRVEGRKRPVEGISTRPTDDSGRRMTDKELGMAPGGVEALLRKTLGAQATNAEREALARRALGASATKAEIKALRDKTTKGMSDLDRARAMVTRPLARSVGGGVNSKLGSVITQAKANMAAAPRAKSTFVDTMPKGGPQKPSSGNPLMGGMNRGDIVASKHTPTRGPSMAPAHSNRPMIRRAMGGLSVMPKGGKC
jgi:hypothetical protein